MIIDSLNAISQSIKRNIIISLISLLALSLLLLNVLYYNNLKSIARQNQNEIVTNFDLLKSHMSEKISIIANSSVFVDYLRSGAVSQKSLKPDFLFVIRSLKVKEVTGIKISSANGENIFSDGTTSPYFVELPLCYFDRGLDSSLGACSHNLILYFDKNEIVKSLKRINDNLTSCNKCSTFDFLSKNKFGSFNVKKASEMPLYLEVKNTKNFSIITINLLIFFVMVVLANWTWRRTHFILEKYLTDPLKKITGRLKTGSDLVKNDEIDELSYLVDQIQDRETKLKQAKKNENLISIGEIASQVAHDIRSPLATINVIVNKTLDMPEQERKMMHSATQQLNDIADNVLSQYRNELGYHYSGDDDSKTHEPNMISILLDSLVSEKRTQYSKLPITIHYKVEDKARNLVANIIAADFKRVVSNIINNGIEAIRGVGAIKIKLSTLPEAIILVINDSGSGMRHEMIRKILNGESVSQKQNGAGIGLASSYKFIKSWGGQLDIASQLNMGTTVTITIPITPQEPEIQKDRSMLNPDLILIDDNQSIRDTWKLAALHKKKDIVIFSCINDAEQTIKEFSHSTPIYIDSNLKDSVRGEQYAKNLYDRGFKNIYLTTGYNESSFEPMPWIKKIVGKEPIFI
jgi:signal transduction histidine kinase